MFDQIYAMLTFGEKHFNPVALIPELKNYTICIDGISKCFAATGVRVGWSFGPAEIISKMQALLGHIGAWAPKPEQEAVSVFLADSAGVNTFVDGFKNKISESLKTLYSGIQDLKNRGFMVESIIPMGALYLTIKIDYIQKSKENGDLINDSMDLVSYLIEEAGMALVPFSAFGNSAEMPWFRASVGGLSLEEIKKMIPRLEKALNNLK
jgi:aspartate aminotransferase